MGGPGLGMIPVREIFTLLSMHKLLVILVFCLMLMENSFLLQPFIEEFNYPMPQNCAGGDTGIFVNGRELHQKDLDLLSSRGLPTTRDRSYIIEISGRVLDEDTGEELDCLGKLAPT